MPADSYNSEAPPPTTPNRWRRDAARLYRWLRPGLITTTATAAVGLVAVGVWEPPSFVVVQAEEQRLKLLMYGFNHPLTSDHKSLADVAHMTTSNALFMSIHGIAFFRNSPLPAWVRSVNPPFTDLDPPPGVPAVRPDRDEWVEWSRVSHRVLSSARWQGVGFPFPVLSHSRWVIGTNSGNRSFMPQLLGRPVEVPYPDNGTPKTTSTWLRSTFLTWIPEPLGFTVNTLFWSTLWMPITAWHRRRRAKRGGCKRCGYSREGLAESAVCPECGTR